MPLTQIGIQEIVKASLEKYRDEKRKEMDIDSLSISDAIKQLFKAAGWKG